MIIRLLLLFVSAVQSQYIYGQQQQQQQQSMNQQNSNQQQSYLQSQPNQQQPYLQRQPNQVQNNHMQLTQQKYLQQQPEQNQKPYMQAASLQENYESSQQGTSRGVAGQVLTPYNISQSNNIAIDNGVTIQFQLRGYSNPQLALPNGWTCVCPPGYNCSYLKIPPTCYFSFTFIISAPDTSVRYLATNFITLDASGSLPNAQRSAWDQNYVIQLPSKPSAIDIFAHNLGAVINQADGTLVSDDTLTHVDTFVVPLSDALPAVGGVQSMSQQYTYHGKLLGTTLYLAYSISCSGSLIGPNCDLTCTQSTINSGTAACRSNATGFFYVCSYQAGGQVNNCKSCPWGIKEDTYCQDEGGGVLDPYHAGVVGSGFRTATIVLSVVMLVLLLLLLLLLLALCVICRRRKPVEKEMTTYEHNGYTAGTPSSRPLLTAAYRAEQPTAQPRSQPPSLDARPIKSSIRKAMSPPEQYDSRDTSFNSDSPTGVRPSRSAVV